MFKLLVLIALSIMLGASSSATTTVAPTAAVSSAPLIASTGDQVIVLVNATLIDGTGAAPLREVAVGARAQVALRVPDEAQVIAVPGATILPGFINAHVH